MYIFSHEHKFLFILELKNLKGIKCEFSHFVVLVCIFPLKICARQMGFSYLSNMKNIITRYTSFKNRKLLVYF